ncbi:peptide/nickel transport system permease protein [Methylobacterium sp. PvP062]|jgi:peptide/nickel transport system permease protein|uniref:Binding-protein-dependent transport systems inner membrane component n=2 Tax=Methylobacterium radiotolerans TaxID=31998 RepID=B1LWG5_METRJ|nr:MULTISPECIES: ABC transporter permease [Methylobacterium]MCX7330446.1 ABC transporter permease [Hyphomicrobiales bacterium]ACB22667.1 binding-protein-dependent transport systems inner membrane component [Methylobacterium radiotolerans JCM 2831]KTS08643.1 ABC transporter permease [Methylobacterium radiotolerans]KTS47029.1 ABC transporter permease [Methylobacterium radiotolerans]KZB98773.1 Glutathione transport system permease protein GsiC [Methylobacterium radiotolerans]
MLLYILKRLVYVTPVAFGVSVVCFLLVHLAPGDPLSAVLPADATQATIDEMRAAYGFDKPLPVQYLIWLWHVLHGDLGTSIATGRPVLGEVSRAVVNSLILASVATVIGFTFGTLFGFVAGYHRNSVADRAASAVSVFGVSVPHYWLGMVLVIVFSANLGWLPPTGAGPDGSSNWRPDFEHLRYLILPAITMSVIPMGIIARTVRALVADILSQDFVEALRAKGMDERGVFRHVVRNAAPTALAIMGLQLGYLLGGSILVETVFAWPGTGFLLNAAIFQRDLPLLQGSILVLAMFFVVLNLLVDVMQTALDPRIERA